MYRITHLGFFSMAISLVLRIHEISLHKHNSCVLNKRKKHLHVLVIISQLVDNEFYTVGRQCIISPLVGNILYDH